MIRKSDPPGKTKGAHKMGSKRFVIKTDEQIDTSVMEKKQHSTSSKSQSTGQFSGPAPRVGGPAKSTQGGVPSGGSKKMVFKSKVRVNRSSASPQAKASARRIYK